MSGETNEQSDLLSDSVEEAFGAGTELPTTDFLVFGLLTFWSYTVWRYWGVLDRHVRLRLAYFNKMLTTVTMTPDIERAVSTLIKNGFTCKQAPKYISVVLYALSMSLIVSLLGYKSFTGHLDYSVDLLVVGIAAVSFCGSSVFFMSFVCRRLRAHEYHELLF